MKREIKATQRLTRQLYFKVAADGTVSEGAQDATVTKVGTGNYWFQVGTDFARDPVVQATCGTASRVASVPDATLTGGQFYVETVDLSGTSADSILHVVATGWDTADQY